jgi:hypothetical protein
VIQHFALIFIDQRLGRFWIRRVDPQRAVSVFDSSLVAITMHVEKHVVLVDDT